MSIQAALAAAKQAFQIVSVHSDPYDQSKCSVGFVDQVNNTWVRLKSIGTDGEDEGYEVRLLAEIFRVDVDGRYEKKIAFLNKNFVDTMRWVELPIIGEEDDVISKTLEQAKDKGLAVILRTEDRSDSILGYVKSLDGRIAEISALDEFGVTDGTILVDLKLVSSVDCNTRKCQVLDYLNKNYTY